MRTRLCVAAATAALVAFTAGSTAAATPLPAHIFAPYFETWTTDSITTVAQQSGARYFTLAFLETLGKSSCTLAWNGVSSQTVSSGRYLSDIASLRAIGGDAFPSFGGWSADQAGTEIGDSCKDVNSIAAAYESVITKYDVSRLDMDVEGRSLGRTAGIDRRNKAIKIVEDWAAAQHRPLQISYTLPTTPKGLEPSGIAIMQNAIANGARVDVVNIMTFDYYDRVTTDMGGAAISAAEGLFSQLKSLYLAKTDAELWALEGNTIMTGIDDYPRKTEVTYVADAQRLYAFAKSVGINTLSMWASQRDNSGRPGVCSGTVPWACLRDCPLAASQGLSLGHVSGTVPRGSKSCSDIVRNPWGFTHVLAPYSGP